MRNYIQKTRALLVLLSLEAAYIEHFAVASRIWPALGAASTRLSNILYNAWHIRKLCSGSLVETVETVCGSFLSSA